jgi:hypothetical protein
MYERRVSVPAGSDLEPGYTGASTVIQCHSRRLPD